MEMRIPLTLRIPFIHVRAGCEISLFPFTINAAARKTDAYERIQERSYAGRENPKRLARRICIVYGILDVTSAR